MFALSGNTVKISASTASTNKAFSSDGRNPHVMVGNHSDSWCNVVFGADASLASTYPTTATAAPGFMIPPQFTMIVTPGTVTSYMAVSLSSGTGVIYGTAGVLT